MGGLQRNRHENNHDGSTGHHQAAVDAPVPRCFVSHSPGHVHCARCPMLWLRLTSQPMMCSSDEREPATGRRGTEFDTTRTHERRPRCCLFYYVAARKKRVEAVRGAPVCVGVRLLPEPEDCREVDTRATTTIQDASSTTTTTSTAKPVPRCSFSWLCRLCSTLPERGHGFTAV